MSNTYIHNPDADTVRLIQITDPHLFKDTKSELLGMNTEASFTQVLTEVLQSRYDYGFVLATGDIVQDCSEQGYLRFCHKINQLGKTVFWLPGNHDLQSKMVEILNHDHGNISPAKQILAGRHWQILLLDSQVYGVPHGRLGQYQLEWLAAKLAEQPDRYVLVVLHHHLLSTNSAWLDQHNLRDAHELLQVLQGSAKVKGLVHGHIHQQVDARWHGYYVMSTPSTCVQFKPDCNTFTLDYVQPGWREIELHADGIITTRVKRIQQASFLPNMDEDGY
ncbi:3',5'-cyclic-AMP phosphodiesterase [Pasteurellaceae bacterium LIM206]|nr:3',5'-cyclic-AMP phosphodiesterase [Pasteurellaceae bacterium LIM206]